MGLQLHMRWLWKPRGQISSAIYFPSTGWTEEGAAFTARRTVAGSTWNKREVAAMQDVGAPQAFTGGNLCGNAMRQQRRSVDDYVAVSAARKGARP